MNIFTAYKKFTLFKGKPRIKLVKTRKGITADFNRINEPDEMMQLMYVACGKLAEAYGVDLRYFVKKILTVDTLHKKNLKEMADPRPYKKKKAGGKNAKPTNKRK